MYPQFPTHPQFAQPATVLIPLPLGDHEYVSYHFVSHNEGPIRGIVLIIIAFADLVEPTTACTYVVNPEFVQWKHATSLRNRNRVVVTNNCVTIYIV